MKYTVQNGSADHINASLAWCHMDDDLSLNFVWIPSCRSVYIINMKFDRLEIFWSPPLDLYAWKTFTFSNLEIAKDIFM